MVVLLSIPVELLQLAVVLIKHVLEVQRICGGDGLLDGRQLHLPYQAK